MGRTGALNAAVTLLKAKRGRTPDTLCCTSPKPECFPVLRLLRLLPQDTYLAIKAESWEAGVDAMSCA
jgi:hypothetical protein